MSGLFTGLLRIEFAPHNIASFDWIRTKAPFEPRILGLEDEETGKKGDFDDALFGCDFHPPIGSPSKQEILRPEPRLQHQENVISMKVDLVKSLSIRRPRPPRIRTASTRR
jgi:hypothetical protein